MESNNGYVRCNKAVAVQAILCPVCNMALVPSEPLEMGQHVLCPYNNKFAYGPMARAVVRFRLRCPFCNDILELENVPCAGRKLRCGSCEKKFLYPDDAVESNVPPTAKSSDRASCRNSSPQLFTAQCPHCGFAENIDRSLIGEIGICGRCRREFVIGGNQCHVDDRMSERGGENMMLDRHEFESHNANHVPPSASISTDNDRNSSVLAFLLGLLLSIIGVVIAYLLDKRNLKAALWGLAANLILTCMLVPIIGVMTYCSRGVGVKAAGATRMLSGGDNSARSAYESISEDSIKQLGE